MSWDEIIKGGSGSDIINGGSGDDFLQGRAGGDFLDGGEGNDQIHGDSGDDFVRGGAGNDLLHGGTGTDSAVYSGSILEYSFSSGGGDYFVNHTGGSMIDGYDRLISIERLVFADAVIDLTQNNAPIAFNDSASTDEDVGTYSGSSVLANDFDWENDNLTAVPGTFSGVYGTLVLNSNGTYSYTPYASTQGLDVGESVQDSFTYTVSDGSLSDTGTLTITVAGRNDAPVANDDTASTTEDAGVSGNVLANDTDVDVEPLTVANPGVYVGAYGTLTLAADGSYTYAPNAAAQGLDDGESAQDVFTYSASDGTASDSATLTVTVTGLNDAPVANDDVASTSEDAAVSGNVLANDTDVDGENLTVTNAGVYVGAYGTLTLAADGSYTYAPNAAAQGLDDGEVVSDVFAYTASDGTASDNATLTVSVNGANDAPVANDDVASTSEDAAVSGNVLANDTDVDGEALTVANPGVYVGAYGTLTLAADGSYTYAPNAAAQGLDDGEVVQEVFTYTASDGTASDSAALTVTVNGLNDAPVANDDVASTSEDAGVSGNVLANDTDVDGETLTVTNPGVYVGAYGTLTLAANGSYTYTPNAAAQGLDDGEVVNDVFAFTASDGTASDNATLTVSVNGANDAPVANDDAASTNEDSNVSGNVLANDTDVDGEALTVTNPGVYAGTYGTLTLAADGSYTYAPNAAANGLAAGQVVQDSFSYTASDGTASDGASLTITVNGANDAPTIDAGGTTATGSVAELPDGAAGENMIVHTDSGAIAFDDVDLTDTHSASVTPQGGGYLGSFTLDPVDQSGDSVGWDFSVSDAALEALDEGEVVTQTYTVTISDGNGGTATQDVTITLTGASDTPTWYIDNSTVGTSANLGTEADPFTSIAAFNAAQGTPGGPGEDDFVNLLFGTGIYAEPDGINLLDGQVLVGLGDPTIAPTAGDGINVGANNNITGINIVSGAGAGIADSGGSVGGLIVSDVDIVTTGGIGIDIGGGGAGVSITGSTIAAGSNYAILGANVAGFALVNSTVSSGAASSGTVSLTQLTGSADFLGSVLNGGGGDTLAVTISSGYLNLTIADYGGFEAVVGTNDGSSGDDGVSITTSGNAYLSLSVVGVDFQGARSDLLEVNATGNSWNDLTITGNAFHNTQASVGGGLLLTGGGPASNINVIFSVEDNSFTGAAGTAITALYGHQSGQINGNIEGNVIGVDDGVADGSGSLFGAGIFVGLEKAGLGGNASVAVSITDNSINDIDGFAGIELRSNGGGAANPAVLEATVSGNTIGELGDFAFAGLVAQVGGSALSGDFAELGLDLDNNVIDAGDADFGGNSIYLQQVSSDAHFYFPGYSGSADGEYMGGNASVDLDAFFTANGNLMTNGGFPSFPGGVDAGIITGATGEMFVLPVWP